MKSVLYIKKDREKYFIMYHEDLPFSLDLELMFHEESLVRRCCPP